MKATFLHPASTSLAITAALLIHQGVSQIVGCDGDGIDCPAHDTDTRSGICSYRGTEAGVGIVSFSSNVSSNEPFTWTLKEFDVSSRYDPSTTRAFLLGSPSVINFRDVTDYGACAFTLGSNLTAALQLPSGFDDMPNFGCETVMGEQCAQDVIAQVRAELMHLVDDSSETPKYGVCTTLALNLKGSQYPTSCVAAFGTDLFRGDWMQTLTNESLSPTTYESQDGCVLSTGGSDYNIVDGPAEQFSGKADSDEVARYKNGTTALFTLFYNQTWLNASAGSNPSLEEPEVHLSCLRKVPTAEQQESGSLRPVVNSRVLTSALLVMGALLLSPTIL